MLILREPANRWNELHDDVLVIPSRDVGLVESLCGILGVNSGRGTRWEIAMKRSRARFPFQKWITGKGEFIHRLLVGQQPDFSICSLQKVYATDVKPTKTRRNTKPDRWLWRGAFVLGGHGSQPPSPCTQFPASLCPWGALVLEGPGAGFFLRSNRAYVGCVCVNVMTSPGQKRSFFMSCFFMFFCFVVLKLLSPFGRSTSPLCRNRVGLCR